MKDNIERGKRFYQAKLYDLAVKEFKRSGEEASENKELAYYLGLALTKLKRYDEALLYLEQVESVSLGFLHINQCRIIRGYIYSKTGRLHLAEFEFKRVIGEGILSRQIFASLGHVSYLMKHLDASIEYLKKSLNIDSEYPCALNSLGYIYAEEEIDKKQALTMCRKAVKSRPDNPSYLDSYGWANYKNGRIKEARDNLRKALHLFPGNKDIANHLKIVISKL